MPNLTVKQLQALKPGDAGTRLRDGENLYGDVKVLKDGKITVGFRWRFRHGGGKHDYTCGTWPGVTLADIRKNRDAAEKTLATGANPNEVVKAGKLAKHVEVLRQAEEAAAALALAAAEATANKSVEYVFDKWMEIDLNNRMQSSRDELVRAWNYDVFKVIPKAQPVRDVTRDQVLAIGDAIKARGAERLARRTFSELRQYFAFAVRRGYLAADPTATVQKAKEYKPDTERERVLDQKQIRALATALPASGLREDTRLAIWIMLATLARVGELTKARWDNVDIEGRCWRIPAGDAKNRKEHLIHLSPFAAEQFRALKLISGHREYCYPAVKTEDHIDLKALSKQFRSRQHVQPTEAEAAEQQKAKAAQQKKRVTSDALLIDGEVWTAHDLRRSGATLMANLGVNGDTVERCLNHVEQSALRRIYQRKDSTDEQAAAWQLLGKCLEGLLQVQVAEPLPGGNVIPINFKRTA
jgi:integrase